MKPPYGLSACVSIVALAGGLSADSAGPDRPVPPATHQPVCTIDSRGNVRQLQVPPERESIEFRNTLGSDPDLEPGFPIQTMHNGGSYHSGPAIHTLVGNIDDDVALEIMVTGLATGPLYAFNHDGSMVAGWPPPGTSGAAYPALGELSPTGLGLEVFSGQWGSSGGLIAFSGSAAVLPGWPRSSANYISTPPALADVDGDGLDEIFIGEEDWKLHAYRADGTELPGWPVSGIGGQERHTPTIADLDGDGDLEIVSFSGSSSSGIVLFAYHADGTDVDGYPVEFVDPGGYADTFPAIGDVDGDGAPEIVFAGRGNSAQHLIYVLSADGTVERTMALTTTIFYGTAPALADLDGDGIPEIIAQSNEGLNVWRGDGTPMPGWPVVWGCCYWLGSSAPVVGDVDGDDELEIVVTSQVAGSSANGMVRVYNANGTLQPGFPKSLSSGGGAVPAIADIDRDGRNEIIITGSYWYGSSGFYDKIWAYDLGGGDHGPIEWGQFGGNAGHTGLYGDRDCNRNGIFDDQDISYGTSSDTNGNGTPDECEDVPIGDFDDDGQVSASDLAILLGSWGPCPPEGPCPADMNGDGVVDAFDLAMLLGNWGPV